MEEKVLLDDAGRATDPAGAASDGLSATTTRAGKSCKGCLFYSSLRKSENRNPLCIGFTRSLKQVPRYSIGESEMEATKEGHHLSDFQYACVGYSVFINNKDNPVKKQENQDQLPFCVGIELLVDRRPSTAINVPAHIHGKDSATSTAESLPANVHDKDTQTLTADSMPSRVHDKEAHPQTQESSVANLPMRTFLSKFSKSSGIVALGVARNLKRVGLYVTNNLGDMFYDRSRPK